MLMHKHSLSWRLPLVGLSALAVALASFAAGLAVRGAFANGDGGVLYACMGERSGSVRIVAAGTTCLRGEVLIHWNVAGPAGPRGPAGATGAQGPQGSIGPAGAPGISN